MAVSPLFQTDFTRAGSALEAALGTFMDTNIKEGKEQYARELKAASPKGYLEIYKEERKMLSALQKQLSELRSKPTGGATRRYSSRDPNLLGIKKLEDSYLERQRDAAAEYKSGGSAYRSVSRNVLDDMSKFGTASTPEELSNIEGRVKRHINTVDPKTRAEKHGFADAFIRDARAGGAGEEVLERIAQVFSEEEMIASKRDRGIYANPDELSDEDKEEFRRLKSYRPGTSTHTERESGPGVDPSVLAAQLLSEIAQQKIRVQQARAQWEQARGEFRELSRGPNKNLAFAPIWNRPSQRSAALDEYARLVEVDPIRARSILDASREEGEFTIPDRLAELKADPDAKGMAPIDTVLDRVGALEALTGYTRGPAEPGRFGVDATPRELTSQDIPTVRQAMQDMLDAVNAPMFEGQKFGNIDSMGDNIELRNYLENGIQALDEFQNEDPSMAAGVAQDFAKELIDWKDSQDKSEIRRQRFDNQPGYAVSRSINRIRTAKREADKTGNQQGLHQALADESNKVRLTDDFLRSAYGDMFLERVRDYMHHQNADYLENDLVELQTASDEAAVSVQHATEEVADTKTNLEA